MAKKKKEEEVQKLDLTELVNYVNYLGEKVAELSQFSIGSDDIRFGMELVENESQLKGIKFFHTPFVYEFCGDVSPNLREFYAKKYGSIPEVKKPDFYAF